MICILDYGSGNLQSVKNALDYLDCDSEITNDKTKLMNADKIIIPGVGAFNDAIKELVENDLFLFVKELITKKPTLGICLGMQLLFEESEENCLTKGFGAIKGRIVKINQDLIIPHMGWNELIENKKSFLTKGVKEHSYVYFVHSYMAECLSDNVIMYTEYGCKIPAIVTDNKLVFGTQFHPEKSNETGMRILNNFIKNNF